MIIMNLNEQKILNMIVDDIVFDSTDGEVILMGHNRYTIFMQLPKEYLCKYINDLIEIQINRNIQDTSSVTLINTNLNLDNLPNIEINKRFKELELCYISNNLVHIKFENILNELPIYFFNDEIQEILKEAIKNYKPKLKTQPKEENISWWRKFILKNN